MVCSAFPAEQIAKSCVIAHHVKMPETVRAAPYTCKQSQYELKRFVAPVGTLDWNATLFKMFGKPAFFKHLEEQGKTAERVYFLAYKFYVTLSHQISQVLSCGEVNKQLWFNHLLIYFSNGGH